MQSEKPSVSVVLPTYNRSHAIRRTIDSVLAQDMSSWELLVISDASTDDTDEVVASYSDPRIKLHRLDERVGHPGGPRNAGVELSSSDVIAYLDHDDIYQPHHLRYALQAFQQTEQGLVATGAYYEAEDGTPQGRTTLLDMVWHAEIQAIGPLFHPSRVIHHKDLLHQVGGWTDTRWGLEDWELWVRFAKRGVSFLTTKDRTVRIVRSAGARSQNLPFKWGIPLGSLDSAEAAQSVHQQLTHPDFKETLREVNTQEVLEWYKTLYDSGELVLPLSMGAEAAGSPAPDWETLERSIVKMYRDEGDLLPLRAIPQEDGAYQLYIDLLVANAEHAQDVKEVFSSRFSRRLKLIQDVLASHGSVVYAQ